MVPVLCEDVYNVVMDFIGWLFSDSPQPFSKLLEDPNLSRTAKKEEALISKAAQVKKLDDVLLPAMLNNRNKQHFSVEWESLIDSTPVKKIIKFEQAEFTEISKDAAIKYVWAKLYLVDVNGNETKIESKLFLGKTFDDLYTDLVSCTRYDDGLATLNAEKEADDFMEYYEESPQFLAQVKKYRPEEISQREKFESDAKQKSNDAFLPESSEEADDFMEYYEESPQVTLGHDSST
jgi:hypothetical protein